MYDIETINYIINYIKYIHPIYKKEFGVLSIGTMVTWTYSSV